MRDGVKVPNFLTFDIEEHYRVNYAGADIRPPANEASNIEAQVETLLRLCAEAKVKCTYFILGSVAERWPGLVRRIHAAGHEIASHGHGHESVYQMGAAAFRADIVRSRTHLESLVGERVIGYRAPSFSVTKEILPWFYRVLEETGFQYSSSVFPGKTFLYGIPDFPCHPHRPIGAASGIIEFPLPKVSLFGRTIGVYVRLLTADMIRKKVLAENRLGRPAILYVHPREIDPSQPRLRLSRMQSLIHYWGVAGCESKLHRLLRAMPGSFTRIGDTLTLWD